MLNPSQREPKKEKIGELQTLAGSLDIYDISYSEIVQDAELLLVGDCHPNDPIRDNLRANRQVLSELGFKHLLLEASQESLEVWNQFNSGVIDTLGEYYDGPVPEMPEMLLEFRQGGWRSWPIDPLLKKEPSDPANDLAGGQERREAAMVSAYHSYRSAFSQDRALVFSGAYHCRDAQYIKGQVPSLCQRLREDGVNLRNVLFLGGKLSYPFPFSEAVREQGYSDRAFMFFPKENPLVLESLSLEQYQGFDVIIRLQDVAPDSTSTYFTIDKMVELGEKNLG